MTMSANPTQIVDGLSRSLAEIDDKIRPLEAALADLMRDREVVSAQLETAREMLAYFEQNAPSGTKSAHQRGKASKGRQPGAISKQWRAILCDLHHKHPEGFDEDAVISEARAQGIKSMRPKDARDRMASYTAHNYIAEINGRYLVTDYAATHFDFEAMRTEREKSQNENEPPEGGSETGVSEAITKKVAGSFLSTTSALASADPALFGSRKGG